MANWPRTYRYLAGLDDRAVDEALAAGVRQLDGVYLRFAIEVLLERQRPEGLAAVVDCYHRLGEDLRDRMQQAVAAIGPVLRSSIRSHELQTRLNSLEMAGRFGSEGLAYLFDLGLMDAQPKVRELAALMIRRMAVSLVREHPLLAEDGQGEGERGRQGETATATRRGGDAEARGDGRSKIRTYDDIGVSESATNGASGALWELAENGRKFCISETAQTGCGAEGSATEATDGSRVSGLGFREDKDGLRVTGSGLREGETDGSRVSGLGFREDKDGSRGQQVGAAGSATDGAREVPRSNLAREVRDNGAGGGEPGRLAQRRQHLFEALLSGAGHYETHLRSEVVEACMWFEPYLGERFWALIEPSRSKLPRLLGELLLSSDEPAAALFLVQAMAAGEIRPAAVKAITERRDAAWLRSVLRGVQLWHPWGRVRKAWGFIKEIQCLGMLDDAGWGEVGQHASAAILISSTSMGSERKAALLERLLKHSASGECRRQVLLEAGRNKEWGSPVLETALKISTDAAEVRMAAYGLLRFGSQVLADELAGRLGRPDSAAGACLVPLAAELVFWRLWTRFDAMREEKRVEALMGIQGVAGYLKNCLRVNLASTSTSSRVRAARMVGLLGLVDVLWRDVLAAARDPSARVRSAVVRFLGRSGRAELQQHLQLALQDNDGRVQANAIEAIDEAGWPDRLNLVLPKLQSEHNRVRGMAAKVLARAGDAEAGRVLTEMLADSRAEYRVTAVWAIKQIGGRAWLERLTSLSREDGSAAVRRLAQSVHRELEMAGQPAGSEGAS